jgi:ketosteroid isomerase-like protein
VRSEDADRGRSPAQVVSELMTAICDGRIEDMLALVDPRVLWEPVGRPALTLYQGHAGMVRLVADLQAAYGRYRLEVDDVTADTGAQVAAPTGIRVMVRARVVQETDDGDMVPRPIRSVFTLRDGLVTSMEGEPDTRAPQLP